MNLIRITSLFVSLLILTNATAAQPDLNTIFKNQPSCFLLYSVTQKRLLLDYGTHQCQTRLSPDSTFKVALSLMAFDKKTITQQTVFKWNGTNYSMPLWNKDQTPKTWLQNSVVWVSQVITPQLGMTKINAYLKAFNYGNQDFSGNPGKNDGLKQAWLQSSLKISPDEQLTFLQNMLQNKLPVSADAVSNTEENLYLETSARGWQLYGKTGNGVAERTKTSSILNSWLVGWVQKGKEIDIFVLNTQQPSGTSFDMTAPQKRKAAVKSILAAEGLY